MSKNRLLNHEVISIREFRHVQVQLWMMSVCSGIAFCFFWFMYQVSDLSYTVPAMTFAAGMLIASIRAIRMSRVISKLFSITRIPPKAIGLDPRKIPKDAYILE